MFKAKVIDNIISREDCEYLIKAGVCSNLWERKNEMFWSDRVISYNTIFLFDKKAAEIMYKSNIACKEHIQREYEIDEEVYSDTLHLVRWFPGSEQPPHADDMSNTEVPGFDHRAFGSIIYLNDNYNGGETYYPGFDFKITPKVGSLAIHPGDTEHLHGVTKIEDSVRYTIASFWTFNKEHADEWQIPK